MAGFIRKRGLTYAIYMHVAAKIQLQHFIPFSKQIGVKMKMKVSMNLRGGEIFDFSPVDNIFHSILSRISCLYP